MKTFYVTFGQAHPLRDSWIEVEARDWEYAHKIVETMFGNSYAMLYNPEDFNPKYFPNGKIGKTLK